MVSAERWWLLSLLSFVIVFVVMAVPTIISGALLPAAVALLAPSEGRTGEGVGLVVLHNTLGALVGSLLAGFLMIPVFGLLGSFRLLAALNLLLAVGLYLGSRRGRAIPLLAVAGLVLALLPMSWDQRLMNSGVYVYAPRYAQSGGMAKVVKTKELLAFFEGTDTTVGVYNSRDRRHRIFTVNGKSDGSTGADMNTQILVGQIPLLLHPEPREVLVIGLGTGITLRGLTAHPVKRIDCVEISPEVVKAEAFFRKDNRQALADPKVRLIVEDGRNLLLTHPGRYDVIVSEPSNPWQSGNANLFTAEFYALAASRLKAGGLFCQWLGLYDITPENLKVACHTFLQSFPRVLLFLVDSDLIMVGADHELSFDYLQAWERMAQPAIRGALRDIGLVSPADLLARHYLGSEMILEGFCQGAPLNTDDIPVLEYSARYTLGAKTLVEFQERNLAALTGLGATANLPIVNLGASRAMVAAVLRELGESYSRAGRPAEAEDFMRQASYFDPRSAASGG